MELEASPARRRSWPGSTGGQWGGAWPCRNGRAEGRRRCGASTVRTRATSELLLIPDNTRTNDWVLSIFTSEMFLLAAILVSNNQTAVHGLALASTGAPGHPGAPHQVTSMHAGGATGIAISIGDSRWNPRTPGPSSAATLPWQLSKLAQVHPSLTLLPHDLLLVDCLSL